MVIRSAQLKPVVLCLCLLCVSIAARAATRVQFVDQSGAPVEFVVVSVNSAAAQTANTAPVMDQVNKQFVPHVLLIHAGESVSFPNSDNIRHHVYSFSAPKNFEIKLFSGTEADPVRFDKPGVVVLGCNIHDQMVGYIYVADDRYTTLSDTAGAAELPVDEGVMTLWHPRLSTDHLRRLQVDLSAASQPVVLDLLPEKKPESGRGFRPRFYPGGK